MRILCALAFLTSLGSANQELRQYVETHLPHTQTVKQIKWHNQYYWIKMADPSKGWLSCVGKKIGSILAPDPILAPTVTCKNDLIKIESRRLKECAAKKGDCTSLVLEGANWILVQDAGQNFEYFIQSLPLDERLAYLAQGLGALLKLHSHQIVQGRASIKDLTIDANGHISFIDLAEDPESFMTADEAKARDLLSYFLTTIPLLRQDKALDQEYTDLFVRKIPPEILPIIKRAIDKTNWISKIANAIKGFAGNDIRKFAIAHRLLKKRLG